MGRAFYFGGTVPFLLYSEVPSRKLKFYDNYFRNRNKLYHLTIYAWKQFLEHTAYITGDLNQNI